MEERGLTGARFSCEERVLTGAFADGQHLMLRRTRASNGDAHFVRRVARPHFLRARGNLRERHLHAAGINARLADAVHEVERQRVIRRRIEDEVRARAVRAVAENELLFLPRQPHGILPEFLRDKSIRSRQPLIPVDEEKDAAARAAGGDAEELLRGDVAVA